MAFGLIEYYGKGDDSGANNLNAADYVSWGYDQNKYHTGRSA